MMLGEITKSPESIERFVNEAYKKSNATSGAKQQLLIIADMLEETEDKKWHADQIRKYCDWIEPLK